MKFNFEMLLDKILEEFGSQYAFAYSLGLSERTVSLKLNGKVHWKDVEIYKIVEMLGLDKSEIVDYFFTPQV